jgi:flagellar motor protein MotB
MARKKKPEEHVNHERWLVSYADFMTLLFATFTALYALSNADKEKFKKMSHSLNEAFSGVSSPAAPVISLDTKSGSGDMVINIMDSSFSKPKKGNGEGGRKAGNGDGGPKSGAGDDNYADPVTKALARAQGQDQRQRGSAETGGAEQASAETNATPNVAPRNADRQAQAKEVAQQAAPENDETPMGLPAMSNPGATPPSGQGKKLLGTAEGKANDAMARQVQKLLKDAGLDGKVTMRKDERGAVISLGETAFFEPGGVDVAPQSIHTLDKVINALRGKSFDVRIEGHTDNTQVGPGRVYHTNEELSALRASRIMEFMIKEYGFPGDKLSAAGFGAWRPIADNATAEGRLKNRRVDLIILNQSEIAKDPH